MIILRFLLGFLLVFTALFLILLVLIQRGRGGGLTGALGGMGGQSAFGEKAVDVFTQITIGVAGFWILLCIVAVNVLGTQQSLLSGDLGGSAPMAIDEPIDEEDMQATTPGEGDAGAGDATAPEGDVGEGSSSEGEGTEGGETEGAAGDAAESGAEPAAAE